MIHAFCNWQESCISDARRPARSTMIGQVGIDSEVDVVTIFSEERGLGLHRAPISSKSGRRLGNDRAGLPDRDFPGWSWDCLPPASFGNYSARSAVNG